MALQFHVDPDIQKASTLPAQFYRDPHVFGSLCAKVFHRTWQFISPDYIPGGDERAVSFQLLEGYVKVPLLLSRAADNTIHCLSNVCTHRGMLLVQGRSSARKLVCGYHGRRFSAAGRFEFMPEFELVEGFPSDCDHLASFPLRNWASLWFTSLEPAFDFSDIITEMETRIGFLPLNKLELAPKRSRTYEVRAHWALYCDNYLEGFHIPFVHKDLDAVLDYGQYTTHLFEHGSLQIGYAEEHTKAVFELPPGHIDYGKKVAAYYFWVFPNLMFNFYPWGLSLNIVNPIDQNHTRIRFISYVLDPGKLDKGAGSGLDKVELEDEAVVEGVHQGLQSAFYDRGRFSPTREQGVHHFHRLLAKYVNA